MTVTTTYTRIAGVEFDASHVVQDGGAPNDQFDSDVTALADGRFAVAFENPVDGQNIPAFSVNGGSSHFPFDTADLTRNAIGTPVITELTNGDLAIIWKEGAAGGGETIFSSVYNIATNTFTAREVSIASNAALTDPEVTAFHDGFFGIVATDGHDVFFRFMYQNGAITVGFDPFVVGPGGSGNATDPVIAVLTDNGFVVTYKHDSNVEARIYDVNGNQQPPLGGVTVADVGASGGSAKVVGLADNGFAVVYDDQNSGGGINLRLFDSAGNGGAAIRVDPNLGQQDVSDPQITVLKNGFILVIYTNVLNDGNAGTDLDIIGRLFDDTGAAITVNGVDHFNIDNTGANDESQSSVAALLDGRFVTTWTDTETDEDGGRISGRVDEIVRISTGDGANDTIQGDAFRDSMDGGGGDFLFGADGDDTLIGGAGADQLDGGDGADTASYAGSAAAFSIDLEFSTATGGDAAGDQFASIENLIGSGGKRHAGRQQRRQHHRRRTRRRHAVRVSGHGHAEGRRRKRYDSSQGAGRRRRP